MLTICLHWQIFFKTQIDQLPEEMHSMALAKNSLDDAFDLARTTKSHEYQHNIKALVKGPVIITAGWEGV